MATNGERQALFFLIAVALLGMGVRACREKQEAPPTRELDRQIAAVENRPARRVAAPKAARPPDPAPAQPPTASGRIDVDFATADQLARVPGISRTLAKRIVADRTAGGTFGCLAALDTVKGVGAATLKRLDSLVSFGGTPRPVCVQR